MAGDTGYEKAVFSADGAKLNYRVLRPVQVEAGKKYPLVVFLHGAGERGNGNDKQLVHGSKLFSDKENRAKFPCFVIFPQCPDNQTWVTVPWSDKTPHKIPAEPSTPLRLTKVLIDHLVIDEPIDCNRIYVMGLSMGGFGTWDFAARYPEVPAAIAPICGGADDSTAPKLKNIPVWAFHGALDTAVWPERSRSMTAALKEGGAMVRYTEYAKVGHNSWDNAFREPELLTWLFAQRKGAEKTK
jgi:predicted peptidase